ncbi:TrlF family AAA-like ATPase [Ralstonia pseudosolanacearum]|uniref:TrlF family AAA-like ATPase n=1 Tax=Ralstonia pseudosolanacearum TaxID=1310165 RepID=UPI001673F869|nr:AAA family ATPase [Ralstonia pseudosolanacearum]
MADYEGMRWFKCDLQMQTPADAKHWRGSPMGESDAEREAAAEAFVRRCYEVGLEVIAITDHNFLSKSFIPLLQQAIHKLTGEYGYRLLVFPGFEFEADVGKGVHVLGLFEPDANLDELDHVLTECGVGYPRIQDGVLAKSTKRLPEVLECVQGLDAKGKQRGLVVMPHATKGDGLFDDGKVSEWLQQTEFLNPELLAIEVPKPVEQMSEGWKRLLRGGPDCDPKWRRSRPIACIMSSDNKALTEAEDAENYIGKRNTWIKMSKPSIEALRQAFLDHESRVRLQAQRPSDAETHPRILKVEVTGAAFLEDQVVHFSPNLNCVIGGRGSGKSSLLEYLRFALQQDYLRVVDADLHEKLKAIFGTIDGAGAELKVTYEVSPGVEDTVLLRPGAGEHRLTSREVHDLKTALEQLHVQFFSQGELSRLTKLGQPNQVLRLVDAACADKLALLSTKETELRSELLQLLSESSLASELASEIARTKQSLDEATRQWQARKDIQAEALVHRRSQEAARFSESVASRGEADAKALRDALNDLPAIGSLLEGAGEWPQAQWFQRLSESLAESRRTLLSEVDAAVEKYLAAVQASFSPEGGWTEVKAELDANEQRFLAACEAKGLQPADVSKLQELDKLRATKQSELDVRNKQLADMNQRLERIPAARRELHQTWRAQFEIRRDACDAMNGPTITLTTGFMLDSGSFAAVWGRLAPRDSRTRLGKNWEEIGNDLFSEFAKSPTAGSPWEVLEDWLTAKDKVPFDSPAAQLIPELEKHLLSTDVRPVWDNVRLSRIADMVDVELKRPGGESAGRLSGEGGRTLSEGQRNTALLSLILAQGSGPIVIDQPEDELDSNYLFSDLVPLLRKSKNQRQLILATHNANLPVNADAELIYAFDAEDGRGKRRAQGGLDRSDVTAAVLDVMEGSEQAFKRRSEKYHF